VTANQQTDTTGSEPVLPFGAARPKISRREHAAWLTGPVDVAVDGASGLGVLTYHVPTGMRVRSGDAVGVPFGKTTRHGMVAGDAGDPSKAVKDITEVFGTRADPSDVALARTISTYHFANLATVLSRLSPTTGGRGAQPIVDQTVTLTVPPAVIPQATTRRRILAVSPHVSPEKVAAAEAARLAAHGQVLILTPNAATVQKVCDEFASGAQRLDSKAPRGAWKGFVEGTVTVGVGGRGAALYASDNLAGIIVLDPSNPGHREARQPRTHTRDVASARSRSRNVSFTIVTANPGPSDMWAVNNQVDHVDGSWPTFVVANRAEASLGPGEVLIPPNMRSALRAGARRNGTCVVVASRTRSVRRCVVCASIQACTHDTCPGGSLCRHEQANACTVCQKREGVKLSGWDKPRLSDLFGKSVKVVSATDLVKVRDVDVVVIFDIDATTHNVGWFPEVAKARLSMLAAAATKPGGTVVIGTSSGKDEAIRDIVARHDPVSSARRALTTAKEHHLPPFGRVVDVTVTRKSAPDVSNWPGVVSGPTQRGKDWILSVAISNDRLLSLSQPIMALRKRSKTSTLVQ
jgi:primosomal protein N'